MNRYKGIELPQDLLDGLEEIAKHMYCTDGEGEGSVRKLFKAMCAGHLLVGFVGTDDEWEDFKKAYSGGDRLGSRAAKRRLKKSLGKVPLEALTEIPDIE